MSWALQIGHIKGTQLRLHFSFLLFLGWIGFVYGRVGGLPAALEGVGFVCLIFLCVLLHEGGHALAAAWYGIRTPDITLLPIGGIARLERMPEKPREEIVVALAGPAVNVVIAGLLWMGIAAYMAFAGASLSDRPLDLPIKLLGVNLWLLIFNLIPAFPMDGGRVFRAVMSLWKGHERATELAASLGQGIAVAFGLLGLLTNPMLILIALVIYFGASGEVGLAHMKGAANGLRVSAAMLTPFQSLPVATSLQETVPMLCHSGQQAFPVVDPGGRACGMLTRGDILAGLRRSGPQTPVAELMRVDLPPIPANAPLQRAITALEQCDGQALSVVDPEGHPLGMITAESLGEVIRIRTALGESAGALDRDEIFARN